MPASKTMTSTNTSAMGDLRSVYRQVEQEITTICARLPREVIDCDLRQALLDVQIFAQRELITAVKLQLYLDGELLREYSACITGSTRAASGPPAGQPPIGALPAGVRVRLVAVPNASKSAEECSAWFKKLGWQDASPLARPSGATESTYGAFSSGGYGVERRLLTHPRYGI